MADDAGRLNQVFAETSFLYGSNAAYIEELHEKWANDPGSVSAEWKTFFDQLRDNAASVKASAAEVGDEALMLARDYDMVIARDRADGLRLIEGEGFEIAIADDAHQNVKIAKDIHLLVVDGDTTNDGWPFGDGSVFPMGPMREPLAIALKRADIVVLWLPDEKSVVDQKLLRLFGDLPVFAARLIPMPVGEPGKVVAFAGIAKPWKFRATLEGLGYAVADFHAYADHEPLSEADLSALETQAQARDATLITTEKDWVKLSPAWREKIAFLPITARFDDQAGFMRALTARMPGTQIGEN